MYQIKIIEIKVDVLFEMPTIKITDFSNCKQFLIIDFVQFKVIKNELLKLLLRLFLKQIKVEEVLL